MALIKQSGNMYEWVTHTHSHLRGSCPHNCSYCYVKHMRCVKYYLGEPKLNEKELDVNYGSGKIIFIEHMSDLFAEGIHDEWINKILRHCAKYPKNKYIIQTKNPRRMYSFLSEFNFELMIGTTIETNREELLWNYSLAPSPLNRLIWISVLRQFDFDTFITIEPVMKFDINIMRSWLREAKPNFVNIGADSKNHNLPEPSAEELYLLIDMIREDGIEIREKNNLGRLLK